MTTGRVAFDMAIRPSMASMRRLGLAVAQQLVIVTDSFQIHDRIGDWHMRVFIKPEDVETVRERLKCGESLTYFGRRFFDDNGGLRRVYDSPVDEIAGNERVHYKDWKKRRDAL